MNTVPDLKQATAIATTGQTSAAAGAMHRGPASTEGRCSPLRIKLSPQGFSIDHPDPELGEH